MCGRYTLRKTPGEVEGLDVTELLAPWKDLERFNVAPTQKMPVILDEAGAGGWLGDTPLEKEAIESLCSPYPADRMGSREVGRKVNNARYDGPECVEGEERLL